MLVRRAHCQLAVKRGQGWDPSREGRMPDASISSTASGPEGALISRAHPGPSLHALTCGSCECLLRCAL